MAEVKWKNLPWLKDDRAWKYKVGILQLRPYLYAKRVAVLPVVDVDWECGMVTILFGWLNFGCGIDWDFDPNYDASKEEVPYP